MKLTDIRRLRQLIACTQEQGSAEVYSILHDSGALLEGHFQLQSGRHSRYFLRFSQIGWNPSAVKSVATQLLSRTQDWSKDATIVCPESAGIFLGETIAQLNNMPIAVSCVDRERRPTERLKHGVITSDRPALIVNDVITTGASLRPLVSLASQFTNVVGILAFMVLSTDRFSRQMEELELNYEWLVSSTWETEDADRCSQCALDVPLQHGKEFN